VRTSEVPAPVDGRHCWVQRVTVPTGDPTPATAALYTFEGDGGPAPEALVGPHSTAKTRGTRTVWARTGRDPQTGTLIGAAAWHEDGVDLLLRTTGAGEELTVRLAASAVIGPSPLAGDGRRVATISEPAATVAFEGHPADLPTVGVAKTMVVYSGLGPVSSLSPTEVVAASGRQLVVQTWRGQDLDAESLVAGQGAAQVEVNGQAGYVFTTAVPAADGGPGVPTERAVLVLESDAGPLAVLDGDGMTPDQLVTLAQELMLR
jgi:hypothetical protein